MAGYILLGTLAAFGLLSMIWAVMGWFLPRGKGCAMVCTGCPEEGILSRYRWMRGLGLISCPLLIVSEETDPVWLCVPGVEICRPEELVSRLELERNEIDRTGNGDPSGHHRGSGVSEL